VDFVNITPIFFLVVYFTAVNKRLIRESHRTIFDRSADNVPLCSTVHDNFICNRRDIPSPFFFPSQIYIVVIFVGIVSRSEVIKDQG
jgi:hypothetical protein